MLLHNSFADDDPN